MCASVIDITKKIVNRIAKKHFGEKLKFILVYQSKCKKAVLNIYIYCYFARKKTFWLKILCLTFVNFYILKNVEHQNILRGE